MFQLTCNEDFIAAYSVERDREITYITLTAKAVRDPQKLHLTLEWEEDCIGSNAIWAPMRFKDKTLPPTWDDRGPDSCEMSCAPVVSLVGYGDENRLTISSSDAKNKLKFNIGVVEKTAKLACKVTIKVGCCVLDYTTQVRIDRRCIPFYEAVSDVVNWWEALPGYAPCFVPDAAKRPMYSSWYSYHQDIDTEKLLEECRYFKKLGCEGIIIDDGWQIPFSNSGYRNCGDWEVSVDKIADIKAFTDAVHSTGMKIMLWFSVPFVGVDSKAFDKFKDKLLDVGTAGGAYVVDPRYPQVRSHLISVFKNAVESWGLDGLKLDFIDSFGQVDEVKDGMDFVSVFDAVDVLMKDIMQALRSINPQILIEFRQSYIGPLMRTFGNIFRSGDCPADSLTNRLNILSLRQTSGNTSVHADMIMWDEKAPAEEAAYQLTNVLFSVPQISVSCKVITDEQKKMLANYLRFWNKYRHVIMDGKMKYVGYTSNYNFVSAALDGTSVCAVYAGGIAKIDGDYNEVVIVNAESCENLVVDSDFGGEYFIRITDCMGNETYRAETDLSSLIKLSVPVNGYVYLTK